MFILNINAKFVMWYILANINHYLYAHRVSKFPGLFRVMGRSQRGRMHEWYQSISWEQLGCLRNQYLNWILNWINFDSCELLCFVIWQIKFILTDFVKMRRTFAKHRFSSLKHVRKAKVWHKTSLIFVLLSWKNAIMK